MGDIVSQKAKDRSPICRDLSPNGRIMCTTHLPCSSVLRRGCCDGGVSVVCGDKECGCVVKLCVVRVLFVARLL